MVVESQTSSIVRSVYRELLHIIKQQELSNAKNQIGSLKEVREGFRRPLVEGESMESRLEQAKSRLSFLRITSPKLKPRGDSGLWVYSNGKPLSGQGTRRDDKGRVISNWDGKNLDPESVSRHYKNLRRAGFVNNLHAKGIF